MKDQHQKLKYLRLYGRNLDPRTQDEIAKRLHIKKSAMSAYASPNSRKGLPDDHDVTLGRIFGFDPLWQEWRNGSFEEFSQRYEAQPIGGPPQSEDYAAQIAVMFAELRRQPGLDNLLGALGGRLAAAMDAARVPPGSMADEEILALWTLQRKINAALAGRQFQESDRPVSAAMAAFKKLISPNSIIGISAPFCPINPRTIRYQHKSAFLDLSSEGLIFI
jgi:hypothetical protein